MLIPQVILAVHNRGKALKDMRNALIENYWKTEDIFKAYMETRAWEKYKRKEATDVVSRKPKLRTTVIDDIPIHIREEHPNYFQ
jgi:hypothetical protein